MMQVTVTHSKARGRHAKRLRTRAESLLKTAAELLDEQGRVTVEQQERAYQLSNEAISLLAQIRDRQAKSSQ